MENEKKRCAACPYLVQEMAAPKNGEAMVFLRCGRNGLRGKLRVMAAIKAENAWTAAEALETPAWCER